MTLLYIRCSDNPGSDPEREGRCYGKQYRRRRRRTVFLYWRRLPSSNCCWEDEGGKAESTPAEGSNPIPKVRLPLPGETSLCWKPVHPLMRLMRLKVLSLLSLHRHLASVLYNCQRLIVNGLLSFCKEKESCDILSNFLPFRAFCKRSFGLARFHSVYGRWTPKMPPEEQHLVQLPLSLKKKTRKHRFQDAE